MSSVWFPVDVTPGFQAKEFNLDLSFNILHLLSFDKVECKVQLEATLKVSQTDPKYTMEKKGLGITFRTNQIFDVSILLKNDVIVL